jgi:hypothetical protein
MNDISRFTKLKQVNCDFGIFNVTNFSKRNFASCISPVNPVWYFEPSPILKKNCQLGRNIRLRIQTNEAFGRKPWTSPRAQTLNLEERFDVGGTGTVQWSDEVYYVLNTLKTSEDEKYTQNEWERKPHSKRVFFFVSLKCSFFSFWVYFLVTFNFCSKCLAQSFLLSNETLQTVQWGCARVDVWIN